MIEFASSFYTLYPGDVYFTGTPHGVGPVKAGDVLRGKCDAIGELEITARQHEVGDVNGAGRLCPRMTPGRR